jgi:predicted transcriptional regulator of viral defense system
MNSSILKVLGQRLTFGVGELAGSAGIRRTSARVLAARYVKQGLFVRLKNDCYLLAATWQRLSREELFKIANLLQVPSYISLVTALAWYEVTTQVPRGVVESISLKRTVVFETGEQVFRYTRMSRSLYGGFEKRGDVFMATPEKAFVDAVYLDVFGKYSLDTAALDLKRLDRRRLQQVVRSFPNRVKERVRGLCRI